MTIEEIDEQIKKLQAQRDALAEQANQWCEWREDDAGPILFWVPEHGDTEILGWACTGLAAVGGIMHDAEITLELLEEFCRRTREWREARDV